MHAIDAEGIDALDRDGLWTKQGAQREPLIAVLRHLLRTRAGKPLSAQAMRDVLASACLDSDRLIAACRQSTDSPWARLDDDGQSMVLAALEIAQLHADGTRRVERASLDHTRNPHGVSVLRAFVDAARSRTTNPRPRIAVVTASAFDPFDPVDAYLDTLRQAGADVVWWPVDVALARAVFDGRGCASLDDLRETELRLPRRAQVYPDLHARQMAACRDPESLVAMPDNVQGVFFTGGDQWRLRRAFFDADDAPNAWLRALRNASARGDVVIGGTSAGSAVQSGLSMLSNGLPAHAVRHGASASAPPAPGCTRARDCIVGLDEDAMTYWPAGGLGLAPGFVVDTHFSERDRELRLVRLLTDTGAGWGLGADETSALHVVYAADASVQIDALGASGGWVFDARDPCKGPDLEVIAHVLSPGARLRIDPGGSTTIDIENAAIRVSPAPAVGQVAGTTLAALRTAARHLAISKRVLVQAGELSAITLVQGPSFRAWQRAGSPPGVFDIAMRVADWPACSKSSRR